VYSAGLIVEMAWKDSLSDAVAKLPGWAGVAAAAVAGAGVAALAVSKWKGVSAKQQENVYVLVVKIHLRPGRTASEFMELWRPFASWVWQNEPRTLTYKASVAESNPQHIIIYERFVRSFFFFFFSL
jgi:hypothetical protein